MSLKLRLFITFVIVIIVFVFVISFCIVLLMRNYVDWQTFSRLDDMTRPIYVQVGRLIRENDTPQQILDSLQEQADKNNAYILLINDQGTIIKQLIPVQRGKLPVIEVSLGTLPQGITSSTQGRFQTTDGRKFLYYAYPILRPNELSIDMFVLTVPQVGITKVLIVFIWPIFIAAGIALIVSLLIAIILGRSIYRPLIEFKKATEHISHGDYDQRVKSDGTKEIKELAESFNSMTENVKQANLRLRHFVADVSHELRSPLTSIRGFAQALLDGTASDEATKTNAIKIIYEESERLKRQVDELLDLSRMQSAKTKLILKKINVNDVLEHCVEVFVVQAKERMIKIELKTNSDLFVYGDQDRLEQVFNNLIDNAVKNSPSGGRVMILSDKGEDNFVRTIVSDNGAGISPEHLPYVFERFYQVTGVRTGVGLGLAIAKEIVTLHNGTIEVSSLPGEGTQFTVKLPFKKE